MYVTGNVDNTVSVIDGKTNTVIVTIPVGGFPQGIAFNSDNGNMYVPSGTSNTVTVIDGQTNTVIGSPIPIGAFPAYIAFNPNNGDLYVANRLSDTVSVIDGKTNTGIETYPVGDEPIGVAFNPNNGDIYVTNDLDDTVSVIHTSTPSESIQNLIDTINDLDISKHAKTSLTASLKIAIKLLTDNNPNNDKAPCRILDAFLATVHSFEAIKQLTSLQAATAKPASNCNKKQFRM